MLRLFRRNGFNEKIDKDLTQGSITKQLLMFSIPFLLSNVFQTLYSIVDMVILGKFSGPISMAAINNGGQVINIFTNIVTSICSGVTVIIGQNYGAGKTHRISKVIQNLYIILITIGAFILTFILLFSDLLLEFMKVPQNSYIETKNYLIITTWGIFFIIGYNIFSSIMKGVGDSKHPLLFVCMACLINIGLDLIFVGLLGYGAAGAAIGTICSQGVSMLCCWLFLKMNTEILQRQRLSFDLGITKIILKMGIPNSVQSVVINGSFFIMAILVNGIGLSASAAVGAVSKFNNFAVMPSFAMGASISMIVAQNIGAGKIERVKNTLYVGVLAVGTFGLLIFIIAQNYSMEIVSFFSDDVIVQKLGVHYLKSLSIDYLFIPMLMCLNGVILGSGHAIFISLISVFTSIAVRIPCAFLLGEILEPKIIGIGFTAPDTTFISLIITIIYYKKGKWKKRLSL